MALLWYPCAMRLLHDAIRNVPGLKDSNAPSLQGVPPRN